MYVYKCRCYSKNGLREVTSPSPQQLPMVCASELPSSSVKYASAPPEVFKSFFPPIWYRSDVCIGRPFLIERNGQNWKSSRAHT